MVTAIFQEGKTNATTKRVWQYDYGQRLTIQGLNIRQSVEVHFSLTRTGGTSVSRMALYGDGILETIIPDTMLEGNDTTTDYEIYAFIYITDDTSGRTTNTISIPVQARPRPEASDRPEEIDMFRAAIAAVNESSELSVVSAVLSEAWARGHEEHPELNEGNARYYAKKAEKNAESTSEDRTAVASDRQVVENKTTEVERLHSEVNTFTGRSETAAEKTKQAQEKAEKLLEETNAAKKETQDAQGKAEGAAGSAALSAGSAMRAAEEATDTLRAIITAGQIQVSAINTAGQEQVAAINTTGEKQLSEINTTGQEQVAAINTTGEKQLSEINTAGSEQVAAVRDVAKILVSTGFSVVNGQLNITYMEDE